MVGLIQEGDEMMDQEFEDGVKDAALISAAQRVEHYEIAAYGCVKTWAGLLGEKEAQDSLNRPSMKKRKLTSSSPRLRGKINVEAMSETQTSESGPESEEEEHKPATRSRGKARSAKA